MGTSRAWIGLSMLAFAGGCAAPPERNEVARAGLQARIEAESPLPAAPPARDVRYYLDEQGMVWDDRGRNLGPKSPANTPSQK